MEIHGKTVEVRGLETMSISMRHIFSGDQTWEISRATHPWSHGTIHDGSLGLPCLWGMS